MFRFVRHRAAGFTLTEMAIVLAVVGVLAAGLWNLLSGANTQMRDESAASQQEELMTAVKTFLASGDGQTYMASNPACGGACTPVTGGFALPLPTVPAADTPACIASLSPISMTALQATTWCSDLPVGFSATGTTNSYGQKYLIHVLRDSTPNAGATPPNTYSFMIMTTGGDTITDTSGARISSLIGGDGGFIYNASGGVCGLAQPPFNMACGSYGGWSADVGVTYGLPVPGTGGYIASRTYASPQQNLFNEWLARIALPGDTNFTYNTMKVPEYLGGSAAGTYTNELDMGAYLPTGPPQSQIGGSTINLQSGVINFGWQLPITAVQEAAIGVGPLGTMNAQGGIINMNASGLTVGGGTINAQGGTINMNTGAGTGGGTINMDGGTITGNAVSGDPSTISLTGSGGSPFLVNLGISGLGGGNSPPLNIFTGCTRDAAAAGPGFVLDASCTAGIQVFADGSVAGEFTANSLFSQTFIYESSDVRLKTDIKPLDNSLADLMRLKPVSFAFKKSGKKSLGVVAQDVEKIYPDLVIENSNGMKSVNYDGFIAPLINAVQELKKENDELRRQINAQAGRQQQLEDELKAARQ